MDGWMDGWMDGLFVVVVGGLHFCVALPHLFVHVLALMVVLVVTV